MTPDAQPTPDIPIADGVYRRLDPRAVPLGRVVAAIGAAVVAVVSLWGLGAAWLGAVFGGGPAFWIAVLGGPGWLALVSFLAWWAYRLPELQYRHASYAVDERGIEVRRGVLWRRVVNVPRSRVQHLDVSQGPLERRFGLGTLVIHTAGTQFARVQLDGLEHGRALRIREHLLPTRNASDAV